MTEDTHPSDVVLLAADWRSRAMLRAELIEDGLAVVATDNWPAMRRLLRPQIRPHVAVIDLRDLPDPDQVLDAVAVIMKPRRTVVLTAIGTVAIQDLRTHGFRVVSRPIPIGGIVRAIRAAVDEERSQ